MLTCHANSIYIYIYNLGNPLTHNPKFEQLNYPPSPPCSASDATCLLCPTKGPTPTLSLCAKISNNSKFGYIGDGLVLAMGLCVAGNFQQLKFPTLSY